MSATVRILDFRQDRLTQMWEMQREFNLIVKGGVRFSEDAIRTHTTMQLLRDQFVALVVEMVEALSETGWKPWATSRHFNERAYKREMVDVWCFFMNLMIWGGMTPEELYEEYISKMGVNWSRAIDGYDGVSSKCKICKRDFNEPGVNCTSDGCANA